MASKYSLLPPMLIVDPLVERTLDTLQHYRGAVEKDEEVKFIPEHRFVVCLLLNKYLAGLIEMFVFLKTELPPANPDITEIKEKITDVLALLDDRSLANAALAIATLMLEYKSRQSLETDLKEGLQGMLEQFIHLVSAVATTALTAKNSRFIDLLNVISTPLTIDEINRVNHLADLREHVYPLAAQPKEFSLAEFERWYIGESIAIILMAAQLNFGTKRPPVEIRGTDVTFEVTRLVVESFPNDRELANTHAELQKILEAKKKLFPLDIAHMASATTAFAEVMREDLPAVKLVRERLLTPAAFAKVKIPEVVTLLIDLQRFLDTAYPIERTMPLMLGAGRTPSLN